MTPATEYKSWVDQNGTEHSGPVKTNSDHFYVIDCKCCCFKHVVPLPTKYELETIYSHEYYTQEKPLYIERYIEDLEWWTDIYSERFERIEEALNGKTGRILDVGSGPGLFLATGAKRGWRVKGIEPSLKAATYSREKLGLDISNVFLTRENASSFGGFDAVHMGEVLEHLTDPREMLEIAHGILRPGGVLSLIVPNDFNPFQEILWRELGYPTWWVAPPHHLNYFDHCSLSSLLTSCGFEIEDSTSTFPIDIFLLMGESYIGDDSKGREIHKLRKTFDSNLLRGSRKELRRKILLGFSKIGLGREIDIICKKTARQDYLAKDEA